MSQSRATVVASEPQHVYRALLQPEALKAWWGCTAVIEARIGGHWIGGWGAGTDDLGHQMVLSAQITHLEPNSLVGLQLGGAQIAFQIEPDALGSKVTLHLTAATPDEEISVFQSWVDAVGNLKVWVEESHRFTPPPSAVMPGLQSLGEPLPPPAPQPAPAAQPPPTPASHPAPTPPGAEAGGGADPFGAAIAAGQGEARVLNDGGFGVTDPNAVVKSWSKEQGFGYVTHPQLGDVVFDYDGCDFEPAPGDQVLLLVLGKRYDGQPKVKRIACPAKGSNIRA